MKMKQGDGGRMKYLRLKKGSSTFWPFMTSLGQRMDAVGQYGEFNTHFKVLQSAKNTFQGYLASCSEYTW